MTLRKRMFTASMASGQRACELRCRLTFRLSRVAAAEAKTFKPSTQAIEDVGHAAVLELGHDGKPELRAFGLCNPQA